MLRRFVVQGLAEGGQVFRQGQGLAAGHIDDAMVGVGLGGKFCQAFGNIGKMDGLQMKAAAFRQGEQREAG